MEPQRKPQHIQDPRTGRFKGSIGGAGFDAPTPTPGLMRLPAESDANRQADVGELAAKMEKLLAKASAAGNGGYNGGNDDWRSFRNYKVVCKLCGYTFEATAAENGADARIEAAEAISQHMNDQHLQVDEDETRVTATCKDCGYGKYATVEDSGEDMWFDAVDAMENHMSNSHAETTSTPARGSQVERHQVIDRVGVVACTCGWRSSTVGSTHERSEVWRAHLADVNST